MAEQKPTPPQAPAAPAPEAKPSVDFTQTPEFKAAVAEAAGQAVRQAIGELREAGIEGSSEDGASDGRFVRQLAMAIAEISDQGTSRKRVAPEVLAKREEARARMLVLIHAARATGQVPVYSLKNKIYLDEVLVDPITVGSDHIQRPTEIEWPGVPNEAMRPANDVAAGIFKEFMEAIGSVVKVVDDAPQRVTPGGLVVHGRGAPTRHTGRGDSGGDAGEGLRVRGRGGARQVVETRVLGTVAAPARQTA